MWFNNALIYRYQLEESVELATILHEGRLKPCPPHARFIYGWLPTIADELVHEVAGCALFTLGKEERVLPRSVIHRLLQERVQHLEMQQNRTIKRAERAQMAEDLEFELLPKSFCIQKRMPALFDRLSQQLIINTASPNQASQLIALLRKSLPSLEIEPLTATHHAALSFANWINHPASLPPGFQLATDCVLISEQDDKKRMNCKGYELPAEEIVTLLSQGLAAAEISMIWHERIQFTLTQDLTLKRLKCLDYLRDDFNEAAQYDEDYQRQDAALTLLAGELRGLIQALTEHLATPEKTVEIDYTEQIA